MDFLSITTKKAALFFIICFFTLLYAYAFPPEASSKIFSLKHDLRSTEIPFRLVNNLIVIPVIVEGQQTLNFLVDTGTSTPVILNKRYVKKLDLEAGRKVRFQGAGGGERVEGKVVPGMHLQVGNAFAKHIGVVILENNALDHLKIGSVTIHGIIGASLFYSFAVEIDYLSQTIRLHEGQTFLQEDTYASLPMQLDLSRPILQLPVIWKDSLHKLNLMVDTGFDHHLLIYDHSDVRFRMPEVEKIGMGYSGSIVGNTTNMQRLHLGEHTFFDVHTLFPLHNNYKAKGAGDGIIGNGLLKQLCVVFDYANHRFHIKKMVLWQPNHYTKIAEVM